MGSGDVYEAEGAIVLLEEASAEDGVLGAGEPWGGFDPCGGVFARHLEQVEVSGEVGDLEEHISSLACSDEFAGASDLEVLFGENETGGGLGHGFEAELCVWGFGVCDEDADGGF